MVEELLEVLQIESYDQVVDKNSSNEEETHMHISPCELAGVQSKLSMRLQGLCNEKKVLLLV
jgi:hypothetical protein